MSDKTLNKAQLIEAVAADCNESKAQVEKVLDAFINVTGYSLGNDVAVTLHGLGTLKPKQRAARKGRNPKTDEVIDIAASTTVTFTVAKRLKDALN